MSVTAICAAWSAATALEKSPDCSLGKLAQSVPMQRTGPAQSMDWTRSSTGTERRAPQSQVSSKR